MSSSNNYSFLPNQNIQFTANATGGVSPYSYSWNFGDGTSDTGNPVTHSYSAAGYYTVTVTVTDSIGETASDSVTINIQQVSTSMTLQITQGVTEYNGSYYTVNGDTLTMQAQLLYGNFGIKDQTIYFYVNNTAVAQAMTDESGTAIASWTVNTTGQLSIYAYYQGASGYAPATSNTVTVNAVSPLSVTNISVQAVS